MLGDVIEDRYLIEAELGEGAMGRVYRARHVRVGRQVAIKVMHRNLARVPAIVERFAREALIAARLRHPNLVSVLDVGTAPDGAPLIVLELAPGQKLSHLIDGPQPAERVLSLVRQLLHGLEHAHAAGLVHRDLKPDNILVERTSEGHEIPRIVDFGIAVTCERDDSIAGRRITEANTVIGTPIYMSPEQARALDVDPRSDLFSLGVIAYELLAGVPPFCGDSVEVLLASCTEDAPSIRERASVTVEPAIEAFVRTLMARRPDDRFQSAQEALATLDHIERERDASHHPPAATRPAAPASSSAAPAVSTTAAITDDAAPAVPPTAAITDDAAPALPAASTPAAPTDRDTRKTRDTPTRRLTAAPRVTTMAPIRRRRAVAGLAFALAAVVAVAGWSSASRTSAIEHAAEVPAIAPHTRATEPAIELHHTARVTPPAAPLDAAAQPAPTAPTVQTDAPPLAAPRRARPRPARIIERTRVIEAVATNTTRVTTTSVPVSTRVTTTTGPVSTRVTTTTGPVLTRQSDASITAATDEAETPAAVAQRYIAVGKALRGAPDELWQRYRRIRINDALARSDSRHAVLATLAEIERALKD